MSDTAATTTTGNDQLANLKAALRLERERAKELRKLLGAESLPEAIEKVREWKGKIDEAGTLRAELESLRSQVASPDEKDATIAELRGKIRERDHRDAFRDAAVKAGVNSEHIADLYTLSGLKPSDDGAIAPDDFADFLASAKSSKAWAFASPQPPGQSDNPGQPLAPTPPGPGLHRGQPERTEPPRDARAEALDRLKSVTGRANPFRIA